MESRFSLILLLPEIHTPVVGLICLTSKMIVSVFVLQKTLFSQWFSLSRGLSFIFFLDFIRLFPILSLFL